MRNKIVPFLALSFFSFHIIGVAQISEEVKETIRKKVDGGQHLSIVASFIAGDKVDVFSYGKTSLTNGVPVDEHTVYEIGSISKVFTTILLAEEIVSGRMSLEDPISKYLPSTLKTPERNRKVIRLKDLATHTSGLPRMPDNFAPANPDNPYQDYSVTQLYDFLSSYSLTKDIAETYAYSNIGMGLLGHILELHTGSSYEQLLVQRITNVLGMDNTRITFSENMINHLAKGYVLGEEVENWDFTSLAGAGGIRSSSADMVKFIQANMKLDSKLTAAMELSHKTAFNYENGSFAIGLGWNYAEDGTILLHNGGTGGYRSFAGFNKKSNIGVVVLTNGSQSVDDLGMYLLGRTTILESSKKKGTSKEVSVPETVLDTYVGVYELSPSFKITISRKKDKLFLQATNQSKLRVYPSSQSVFFLKVVEANIEFNLNNNGQVVALTLNQNGQTINGAKIE